jgi:hypothetical protein
MRMFLVAAFLVAIFETAGLAAVPASAMPIAQLTDAGPDVTLIAQGCGPGGWRGPYGRCNYGRPPGYGYGYGYRPPPPGFYRPPPGYYGGYGPRPYHRCWWRNGVRICN